MPTRLIELRSCIGTGNAADPPLSLGMIRVAVQAPSSC